jgi:CheY-like chemotaxis protein/HEAT repeat protein
MAEINPADFIEELKFDIKTSDLIKARLVLEHLGRMDAGTQKLALLHLARAKEEFVIPLIVGLLAAHPDLGEAFPTLKEIVYSNVLGHPQILTRLLLKETKREYRIILTEIAGETRLEQATPILLSILNGEQDEKVLRGAVTALGMIGDLSATSAISEYLYSNTVELTIAAIFALGQLASPTAIQRLAEKLGADPDLDLMILDVFARSESPEALEKLNDTLSSHHASLRNAGKARLAQIGTKAVPELMKNLRGDDPDLLIHTLNLLGQIGDESAITAIRKLLFAEPKDANVRFAAYEALGRLPVAKGAIALVAGLQDPVENVRTAAASAIDHNYTTVLAAGLKNMVREKTKEAEDICKTILTAQCDNIFLNLIEEPAFIDLALEILRGQSHPETRDHFADILATNGKPDLAQSLTPTGPAQPAASLKIFAVDDSKMILNIYRSVLHELGYETSLFEFPAEAVAAVSEHKPAVVLTDLNMPEVSGIELTRAMRQIYSKEDLPIIMVTTQNEVNDNEAAYQAGVNGILHKPFNAQSLGKALAEFAHLDR